MGINMNIYYLYNSGFTVEAGGDALVFDYWRRGLAKPWNMPLPKNPGEYHRVLVFASHAHGDHYNRAIFDWLSERRDIAYILSEDIRQAAPATLCGNGGLGYTVDFISPGGSLSIGGLEIKAYGSTDAGVSFHVVAESGESLFHAGDFNFWHWRDESSDAEVAAADLSFSYELEKMRLGIPKIDVAFFPVDPRMGGDYYRGAVRFCEALRPSILIPMHFSNRFEPPVEFFEEIAAYTRVVGVGPSPGKAEI